MTVNCYYALKYYIYSVHVVNTVDPKDVKWFENYDLHTIVTPVKVNVLERLLHDSGYDEQKSNYLIRGFKYGFKIGFEGDRKVQRTSPNLPFTVGDKLELWNKVMTEVEAKRFAGPYKSPPYKFFIQSPIGLVPKDKGTKNQANISLILPKRWCIQFREWLHTEGLMFCGVPKI